MAYPDSFLQELSDRNDIVDVVSGYVKLTKKSGSNLFGLCPFHSEKTASFSVSSDKQIYHCFGCGKGGSVISFIMEIENLTFPEAVEFLARRAGVSIPEQQYDETRRRRERMLALNREAARFFHDQLQLPGGRPARDYIKIRGISGAMLKNFGLGFAPSSWDALAKAMSEKGYSDFELADAGLVRHSKNGSGVYDTFRNRLMFPVIDVRGNVIGFSGRILDDGEPKYMNSPETLVFNKSRNLFALNLAKKSKSGYIILSEGNIDVISLHQAGFDSAVASLGTSLTADQARLISRYTDQVVIAYDSDTAGQAASERAIGILDKLDLKVRVLSMQGTKDPDEYIRSKGADAFRSLLEKSENHIEYRLGAVKSACDLATDEGRLSYLRQATELIASLGANVEREVYSMRAAETAGVSAQAVTAEVERRHRQLTSRTKKQQERQALSPSRLIQPKSSSIKFANPNSARAELGVIRLLYRDPELFRGLEGPNSGDFSSPELARIYTELRRRYGGGETFSLAALGNVLEPDELALLSGIINDSSVLSPNREQELADYIKKIQSEKEKTAGDLDFKTKAEKIMQKKGHGG